MICKKILFFILCVANIYLSFTSHYFTDKKCVFITEDGHVTGNVLNNNCFFKAFLALLFIIITFQFKHITIKSILCWRAHTKLVILIYLIRWFFTATSGTKPIIVSAGHVYILLHQREK